MASASGQSRRVLDGVSEAVVQDHRGAIAALVLEVQADSVSTIRRVRHRSPAPTV
jgi:hypothetical protein